MKRICSHCHLEYDEKNIFEKKINGISEYFCCRGCESVFRILQDANLKGFYEKLGDNTLSPPKEYKNDLAKFDTESFENKYIKKLPTYSEISLIIEGIHCIACVWLNQKILNNTKGIISVDINYTNNKAKILYEPNKLSPSKIIEKVRSIGYDAQAYDPKIIEDINTKERKDYYTRMIIGIFCSMNIMWIAVAQYSGYFLGMEISIKDILNFASFMLTTPTLFYSGWIFFKSGYSGLKHGFINMDLLVSFGSTLTYIYSIYASITHSGETYFESVTMIITFILIGKFLEVRSRKNAGDSIDKLYASIPSHINIIKNNKILSISPQEVEIGDIIEVKPGEKIIIDGILLDKIALLDSSMLTGESEFVKKDFNDILFSGSINIEYTIHYKATKKFEDSTMSNIINLIQDSINKKPNIESKANAVSYHFSAFVLMIAIITFILWAFFSGSGEKAMIVAVSVIIIACPCALALATPIATIVGISEAYKNRILFKEAKFLETMAKSDTIVFDKTGTLTFGEPKVVNIEILEQFNKDILYSFVRLNDHPISNAISEYFKDSNILELNNFKQINQKGIQAKYKDSILLGGSRDFIKECGVNIDFKENDSYMKFYFVIDNKLIAIFSMQDKLKDDAKYVISYFLNNHFRVVILSGDRLEVVKDIAKELGVSEYYAKQSPLDKSNFIDKLHKNGHKCIMVGDGINDAIALNKSNIAISMGKGSDIAIESSDVVLLDDSLKSLLLSYKLAKKTYQTIKQNIKISIIYNLLTIPLASFGFIIPLFAALSMSFSSLIVCLNSLRIKRKIIN
ncbi:heavy metal translocating P-type ATPase [Helicobacter sp. MIT 14-3879]|uniref:heavy metal translocating P-type ATPase n=1 Tax=Helicobacter sp. MIT 14-3879 TaxID=2040649 RepID=UPI000E1F9FDC|nr:heavy metal translocating P-type ATPase [Helicobacter sp. MIT 14-3879]RDU62623.1 heavy metal translocating P-type ATPase [Helicobacter sp. MIT 14-3879]